LTARAARARSTYPNNGGTYGAAGEPLTFGRETRQYNVLGELTRITIPQFTFLGQTWPGTDLEYRYSATANNGQIVSRKDYVVIALDRL
jgi:hypothetical protein